MKNQATSIQRPLSFSGYKIIHAVAVAGLLLGAMGTATSRADILYVGNANSSTIGRFTSDGVGSAFASSGLNNPHSLV